MRVTVGLDYADQRYYSNQFGRFMSPDPYVGSAALTNPQSWNRYSYVQGDPVNYNDPSGQLFMGVDTSGSACGEDWIFDASLSGPCIGDGPFSIGISLSPSQRLFEAAVAKLDALFYQGNILDYDFTSLGSNTRYTFTLDASSLDTVDLEQILILLGTQPEILTGAVTLGATAYGIYKLYAWFANRPKIQPSDCPKDQREPTPATTRGIFQPVRGSPCKVNPETGEIWCQDQLHNDHWEVYKTRRDWEQSQRPGVDKRDRSVWDNGCIRQKF